MAFMGMMPWGSLLLGFLATRIGVSDAVTGGAIVVIASAAVAYLDRADRVLVAPAGE
jgi:hypothetical protein